MQPPVGSRVPNDMVEPSHLLALDQLISGLPAPPCTVRRKKETSVLSEPTAFWWCLCDSSPVCTLTNVKVKRVQKSKGPDGAEIFGVHCSTITYYSGGCFQVPRPVLNVSLQLFNLLELSEVLLLFPLYGLGYQGTEGLSNLPMIHITLLLKLVFSVICCGNQ